MADTKISELNAAAPLTGLEAVPAVQVSGNVRATARSIAALAAVRREAQAQQSNRYLMRDGMFRDPLVRGTGVLTLGAIETVTDDTKYNSWPQACRLRDGRLMIAYQKGDSHNQDNTGRSVGRIGVEELDGSITWGSEIEIYDHPSLVSVPYGLSQVSSGRIFASIQQYDATSSGSSWAAGVVYSDDDGATWSDLVDFTSATGLTGGAVADGPVVELRNGDLLCLAEGYASGDPVANRSSVLVRSTDGGLTWGDVVTVRAYADDTRPYYESMLALLDDDSLLILHRVAPLASSLYAQKSTDGGATWGEPYAIFSGWGAPRFIQASTGTLIAIMRRSSDGSAEAFASVDRGLTWGAGVEIDAVTYTMQYGCPVELSDGRILAVYGDQPTSALTNSDIKTAILTEGKWALDRRKVTALASSSGVVNIDCGVGDYFTLALTENVTSLTFSNLPGAGRGATLMLRITQDSTARTVAWPSSFRWAGGSAGSVSTGSGDVDVLAITTFDNGVTWRATLAKDWA